MRAGLAKARSFAGGIQKTRSMTLFPQNYTRRRDDAVDLLEKAIARRPSADALIEVLSGLYARGGDPGTAEAVLNTRLQVDPKDIVIRSILASLYLTQKKYDNAIGEYTRVVPERPTDATALNNLAWLYQRKGDLAKARGLAEQAVGAAPRAPLIEDTLGWILVAQGEADKALTYLSAANLSAPKNPDIQYHLAVALNRLGRTADARATLETLLNSDITFSDRAEAEKLLQQLKRG
jgi:Flp pilus assembly protein TadD